MTMYKIQRFFDGSENTIIRKSDNTFIPRNDGNMDYQQFVNDIYENGIGIVEGADYVGVTTYTEARRAEYPPIADQLDKIYHEGIDAWKADIKVIKDKYPKTQVGITSIAPIPDWVNTALFDKQKMEYIRAKERLALPELSVGVKDEDGNWEIKPEPLYVYDIDTRNPLVMSDEEQRRVAQEVINNTPQEVINSVSN